jgi:hypothetical protein
MRNPNQERSRRFESEKNARQFSETVKGDFKDLRNQSQSKSSFKVTYTKENAHNGMKNID